MVLLLFSSALTTGGHEVYVTSGNQSDFRVLDVIVLRNKIREPYNLQRGVGLLQRLKSGTKSFDDRNRRDISLYAFWALDHR